MAECPGSPLLLCDFCCSTPPIISVRVQLGAWCMAKCAYCAEPLPDSDDEECDEGKEEDDGGCGEGGFCDDFCRRMKEDDRRWDQETLGFSLSEQLAKACFLGDESRVEKLLIKGAPVSQAVPGAIAASLGCALRLTPLAAACMAPNDEIGQTFGIVQKLFDCGADSHTAAVCETHGGHGGPPSCLHGKTPCDLASSNGNEVLIRYIQRRVSRGRHRNAVSVKQRAQNAGVTLPSTPDGVRDDIANGSPGSRQRAKVQLQRHQKACHQLVSREEAGSVSVHGAWLQERARSLHNEALARSHSKRKANGKVAAALKRRKEALAEENIALSAQLRQSRST